MKIDINGLKTFKISNGALKNETLPRRLKFFAWGDNKSTDGNFRAGEKTATELAANQKKFGFERVAIDFNHCSVPGTDTYKDLIKAGQPPLIFGYGRVQTAPGDGIYLEDIIWTPLGVQHARNFEDLSPAIQDDGGEVTLVHSVALTPNGKVEGLEFFSSMGGDASSPGSPVTLTGKTLSATADHADEGKRPEKKASGHNVPPKGYPENREEYADPENFKYPLDTETRARAAWDYIHKEENRKEYSAEELKFVEGRIQRACKRFGIHISDNAKTAVSTASAALEGKALTLLSVAGMLGLPETAEEKLILEQLAARLSPASDSNHGTDHPALTTLSARIEALEKKFKDIQDADATAEREQIVRLLSTEGKAPIKADHTAYSRDELLALDVPTLKLLRANAPVTVPLAARAMTSQVDGQRRFVSRDAHGNARVDLAGIFNSENQRNGQAGPRFS